jgi:short-chain fatty acids transporter
MNIANSIEKTFKKLLPSPFTIAVLLTFASMLLAFLFTRDASLSSIDRSLNILQYWEQGLWNSSLMVFAMQMMLMLVLGHVLALSKPVNKGIEYMTAYCNSTANAAFWVCLLTLCVSLFNWGLGLIFGAVFARKVAENAQRKQWPLHYPIIGACGYSGLMVWHGGISGSAPIKAAESGHLESLMTGLYNDNQLTELPNLLSFTDTVFSTMNISVSIVLLIVLPSFMYFIAKRSTAKKFNLNIVTIENENPKLEGAEKLDHSKILAGILGASILAYAFYKAVILPETFSLNFISPNFINFTLLGLGILLHGNFSQFLKAIDKAIGGASGILIQFPLYFGIMGIMKHSGMINHLSEFFVSISTETTFPIFTFVSAGIVNIFVPSGGGQWAIQGPIIIEASQQLGLSLAKNVMALAYGDQLTNMLQPFWALPLLGITGLKAKEILPYTLMIMAVGATIFIGGLLIY